jgi:hypothetical protein
MSEETAIVPAQAALPGRAKLTLRDLIGCLATIDQADPELIAQFYGADPAELIGDLRDKVDDVYYVLKRMESVSAFLKAYVAPIVEKRQTLDKMHGRLWDYVALSMRGDFLPEDQRQRTETLPGNVYRVTLRDSNPSLKIKRGATAQDFADHPELVEMRRSYEWKNDAVKERLISGAVLEFAEITRGCWPDFRVKVPEQLESKSKRKGAKKA